MQDSSLPPSFSPDLASSQSDVRISEQKIPRFRIVAGVGGVLVYLLGSIPLVIIMTIYVTVTHSGDSAQAVSDEIERVFATPEFLAGVLLTQCIAFLIYAQIVSFVRGSGNIFKDIGVRFTWTAWLFIPAGFLLQFVGILMNIPLSILKNEKSEQEVLTSFKSSSGVSILILALLFSIIVPIVEEMCFRGLFQRGLQKRFAPWIAVLLSGSIFAVVHFADPNAILGGSVLLLMGLCSAALATYRGRIDASICLHIGFNMTTVLLILVAQGLS